MKFVLRLLNSYNNIIIANYGLVYYRHRMARFVTIQQKKNTEAQRAQSPTEIYLSVSLPAGRQVYALYASVVKISLNFNKNFVFIKPITNVP